MTHLNLMHKPTLFVCQSCHHFSEERPKETRSDPVGA